MKKMKKAKNVLKLTSILTIMLFLFSCNPIEDETRAGSLLVVVNITGSDVEGNVVNYIQSDVQKIDTETGSTTVAADGAVVHFTVKLLDPREGVAPSHYNSIQVTRYTVTYFRSDGKNAEGVDIPYAFEGGASATVEVDGQAELSFIAVREAAKLESPLLDLRNGGGEGVIEVTARIDFYGHDLTNRTVKATGYITVFFADYITEEEE